MEIRSVNPLRLFVFILCVIGSRIIRTLGQSEHQWSAGNACAHFNVSEGKSFDIYDGHNFSQGLDNVFNSKLNEYFYSVQIREGCAARLCILNFLSPTDPVRKRECWTVDKSTDFDEYYYIVTTSCTCQNRTDNCRKNSTTSPERCEKAQVELEETECVRLFVEEECKECRFGSVSLSDGESLIPTNGFSTNSFVVKEGCAFIIESQNVTQNQNQSRPDFIYTGIQSNIQLSYVLRPIPSKFTCSCDPIYIQEITGTSESTNSLVVTLSIAIPVILLVAILIALKFIVWKKWKENVKAAKVNQEIIKRFEEGEKSNLPDEAKHAKGSTLHYVSIGFQEALLRPYQNRYEVSRSDVIIGKVLEKGNFGIVYFGKLKHKDGSSTDVAVKESKGSVNLTYFTSLLDEIKILSYIGTHPNIVSLIGACTQDLMRRNPLLLLEFCTEGSLKTYLKKNRNEFTEMRMSGGALTQNDNGYASFESINNIPETEPKVMILPKYLQLLIKWSKEISSGMNYLSQKKVVHADLATRNILLTKELVAKISDFGLSQRLCDFGTYVRIGEEYPLPIRWMSVESLTEHQFTPASDIWSYGVCLWEIFSLGENPYKNMPPMTYSELINFLTSDGRLPKPIHASNEIYSKMHQCWSKDPESRPAFEELFTFFEDLEETNISYF